ncbi:YggS family pyridoxal phosphate-dependent enzyme [Terrimonas sp. NA20]|uniref:Pyridoxal phosphate homeostasis protein n=1 Tax=Terrimonas ginsenosidimutans TaxID=2908004 RepID=A0ABS9KZM3_9BACT|nr:YggS family pyridoxal phosphate-dependent enzyme [Terrimonas ginsenosidimutans]MCG2617827.1 YggS family pyridoxal phosphate-dependent enzyme [Terrimonas ginsenosidimutans]
MSVNKQNYASIRQELGASNVTLVAVSKIKPAGDIQQLYDLGQHDFGENYVQELVEKQSLLPTDIRWHFIGHLQSNKVKYIAPFVHLIHGVTSVSTLKEINKQGQKNNRVIDCLLQVHIAQEETKFGFDANEIETILSNNEYTHANIIGLMGMASFSEDLTQVRTEFATLKKLFDQAVLLKPGFNTLSMGMSGDYKLAIEEGSTMVRIGSLLFGNR